jgi:hypothetical protein
MLPKRLVAPTPRVPGEHPREIDPSATFSCLLGAGPFTSIGCGQAVYFDRGCLTVGRCLTVGPSMLTHRPNASRTAKLVELVEEIEARGNQAFVGSILLLHSNKLYHEAAPHLPAILKRSMALRLGQPPAHVARRPIAGIPFMSPILGPISIGPPWTETGDLAAQAELRACWPVPIMCGDKVLGTFAVYHREARSPARRGAQLDSRRSAICRRYTCSGSRNIMHEVGMQPQEEGESAQRHTLRPPTPQRSRQFT